MIRGPDAKYKAELAATRAADEAHRLKILAAAKAAGKSYGRYLNDLDGHYTNAHGHKTGEPLPLVIPGFK